MLSPQIGHAERPQRRQDMERQVLLVVLVRDRSQLPRGGLQPARRVFGQSDVSILSIRRRVFAFFSFFREQVFGLLTSGCGQTDPVACSVAIIDDPDIPIFAFPDTGHVPRLSMAMRMPRS